MIKKLKETLISLLRLEMVWSGKSIHLTEYEEFVGHTHRYNSDTLFLAQHRTEAEHQCHCQPPATWDQRWNIVEIFNTQPLYQDGEVSNLCDEGRSVCKQRRQLWRRGLTVARFSPPVQLPAQDTDRELISPTHTWMLTYNFAYSLSMYNLSHLTIRDRDKVQKSPVYTQLHLQFTYNLYL